MRKTASTSYILTSALLIGTLVTQVTPSYGGAGSILDSTDPLKAAPPLQTRALGVGDMTVASRTGAFEYTYSISVPPGRLGNQPSLALSYSSQGALRGGIASGWSMALPEIHQEIPEATGREDGAVFISSLSGGHRLVKTNETPLKGFDEAYRAEIDDSYIRYSMDSDPSVRHTIVARSSDGSYYEFSNFRTAGHQYSTRWPLHLMVDKYGNTTRYEYETLADTGDNDTSVLVAIEYGANDNASLSDFARIEFHYNETELPCPGTSLVPGARLEHRGPFTAIHGSKTLDRIDVLAKPAPGAAYLYSRSYELSYDSDAARCDQNHGPLRILNGITEHAPKFAGDPAIGALSQDPAMWISKPQVEFGYGPLERSWNDSGVTGLNFLGRGGRADTDPTVGRVGASMRPSLKDMLIDFNGDGIVDRLSSVPVTSATTSCEMEVRLGDGSSSALSTGTNGIPVSLPTLPWKLGANPWLTYEDCSLSGQYTKHETRVGVEECENLGAYNSYRFMDMDADGLPDLVTEVWADLIWFAAWDDGSGLDNSNPPPPWANLTGECPLLPREKFLEAEVCQSRDYCYFDQELIQADIVQANASGDSVPCGVLYRQINPVRNGPVDIFTDTLRAEPHGGIPPDPDDPPLCPTQPDRAPEVENGGYRWRWYKNTGGSLAANYTETLSPIPLVANGGDSTLGHGPLSSGSAHGLYDITGDGFIDAISFDFDEHWSDAQNPPPIDTVLNANTWWVWPGDGAGGFGMATGALPIAWHVPPGARPSVGAAGSLYNGTSAGPHYWVSGTTNVQDVNGDGLPDLLKEDDGEMRVYLNTGMGFRSGSTFIPFNGTPNEDLDWPYGGGVEHSSFSVTTDDSPTGPIPNFVEDATRTSRLLISDIDGDGLPDVYTKGSGVQESSPQKLFGAADGRLLAAKTSTADSPRRLLDVDVFEWRVRHDSMDINGDGVVDQIFGGTTGSPHSQQFLTDDFAGKPLRLMNSVTNGRGLTTEIRYAPNNKSSIAIDATDIKGMPNHVWVVDTVSRSENLGAGIATSPDSVVEVKYGGPAWNEDNHGHWGFRGFETIETSAPHEPGETAGFAVTRQDYDFSLDYSGRLTQVIAYVDGFPVHNGNDLVASIANTTWQERLIQNDLSRSYVVTGQTSRVCSDALDFVSEGSCASSPVSSETRTTHGYFRNVNSTQGEMLVSSPVQTWTSETGGYLSDGQAGSITNTSVMHLFSTDETYQLVSTQDISKVGDGTIQVQTGHTIRNYSATGRDLLSQEAYLNVNEPHSTGYGTDTTTGNPTSLTKPEQYQSGIAATSSYSGHQVFAHISTNEIGHASAAYHDVGTGKVTRTLSSNLMDCATGSQQYEGSETTFDGFGRPIDVFQYGCDSSGSYAPLLMQSFKYFEFDGAKPASVAVSIHLDEAGSEASTESYFDSYGRIVRTTSETDEGDVNVHYQYGVNGKVASYNVPNPALNDDAQRSEYRYQYDTVGRQIGVRIPDNAGVAPLPGQPEWDNGVGVDTSYGFESGLSTLTTREIVQDGGTAAETKRYTNNLGQLVQVDERMGVSIVASTYYQYDGNGNMNQISDADGKDTVMNHDWLSRRTKIIRGNRVWEFEYDQNGNLILETAPYPSGGVKMNYQTSYAFDVLDRPTSVVAAVRDLNASDQALFGSNIPVQYSYDSGDNGIGRLNTVSGPFYSRNYTYGTFGRIATETFDYDLSGTALGSAVSGSKTRTFSYNRAGSVAQLGTATGLSLSYQHDSAGREKALTWENASSGSIEVARLTRNVAGSVTDHATNSQVARSWRYDRLGRVERTDVSKGSKVKLSEEMVYFDSNEVNTMQITRKDLADRTFTFDYDMQHQLVGASDNLGEYNALFKFSSAGRVEEAYVANVPGAPQVIARDVSYQYGDGVDVDSHTVETLENPDGSPFATYTHDLSGNVLYREEPGQGTTFDYDGEDRQRRVQSSSGYGEVYFYDEKGQRFLAVEVDPAGSLERSRMWFGVSEFWKNHKGQNIRTMTNLSLGSLAVARVDTDDTNNTSLEYSFHNGLGHLMGTVDESGLVTTAFVYGPFGEIMEQSGAIDNHLRRFNGKEADQLSRLNYYGYRYYDPLSLQWTQADPLFRVAPDIAYDQPRLMSLYTFSLNNPVRYMDPDGRYPGESAVNWVGEGVKNVASSVLSEAVVNAKNTMIGGPIYAAIKQSERMRGDAVQTVEAVATAVQSGDTAALAGMARDVAIGMAAGKIVGVGFPKNTPKPKLPGCFGAGTLVATSTGLVRIEEVQSGDLVDCADTETSEWHLCEVESSVTHPYHGEIVTIRIGTFDIEATSEHPFWVVSGQDLASRAHIGTEIYAEDRMSGADGGLWVAANQLEIGDLVASVDGQSRRVEGISKRDESLQVFNLLVAEHSTYVVGKMGVLVHNGGSQAPSPSRSGGGKTGRKQSKDALARGNQRVADARTQRDSLRSMANKTKADKAALKKAERALKKAQDQLKASENHAQTGQGPGR